ncbi:MAG: hypothetical protein HQK54_12825, partial [Oligoflexales bacterium]|nr:hypothetical protein [Oligoflexales bacterium]
SLYLDGSQPLEIDFLMLLDKNAHSLRTDFNEWVALLGNKCKKSDLPYWWTSELASRNTIALSLYNQLVELFTARQWIELHPEIKAVYFSSSGQVEVFRQLMQFQHGEGVYVGSTESFVGLLTNRIKPWFQYLSNVYHWCQRIAAVLCTRKKLESITSSLILVDIFVLEDSFGPDGFRDRYYNYFNLEWDELKQNSIRYVPIIYARKGYFKLYKNLRRYQEHFIVKEDYLNIRDWFSVFLLPFRLMRLIPLGVPFRDVKVDPLVREAWNSSLTSQSSMDAWTAFLFPHRLKKAGIKVRKLIEWFENQVVDKCSILGFHQAYSDIPVVGYQISQPHQLYLCLFPTRHEYVSRVLPDKIAVCGQAAIEERKKFFDHPGIILAPAFRYCRLWNKRSTYPDPSEFTISLLMPFTVRECELLLEIVSKALSEWQGSISIFIKKHPAVSSNVIARMLDKYFIGNLKITNEDTYKIIEKSNFVVSNNSGITLEAVAMGTPVVIIGNDRGLSFHPMGSNILSEMWRIARTPTEFIESLKYFSNISEERIALYNKESERIRALFFEPTTKQNGLEFINNN